MCTPCDDSEDDNNRLSPEVAEHMFEKGALLKKLPSFVRNMVK